MREYKSNNLVCAGQFSGGEIEPGTFHDSCRTRDLTSKAGDDEPKKVAKEAGSDAESREAGETSSEDGEGQS